MCSDELEYEILLLISCFVIEIKLLLVYIGMNNKIVFLFISVKILYIGEVKLYVVKIELRK